MPKQPQKPETQFRIGSVSASVFVNATESGRVFRNVQLQRSFREDDEWKFTTSFSLSDLPVALRVLELALRYIENKEAKVM